MKKPNPILAWFWPELHIKYSEYLIKIAQEKANILENIINEAENDDYPNQDYYKKLLAAQKDAWESVYEVRSYMDSY